MNKKAIFSILTTTLGITLAIVTVRVDSFAETSTDWSKTEATWNVMLAKTSTPPSVGNILTDGSGGKSDCHLMSITSNKERRNVTNWTCWGEQGHSFPKVSTRWSTVKPMLSMAASTYPTPNPVGNTLINSIGRKHDCHLTNHLKNNQGGSVSEWTCWSFKKF